MKKAKNEISKLYSKNRVDFEQDDKIKKVLSVPKQKKPLSIYDNFDDDEVEDIFDIDDEIDDYHDSNDEDDYFNPYEEDEKEESIWDYMDEDE